MLVSNRVQKNVGERGREGEASWGHKAEHEVTAWADRSEAR